MLCIFLLDPRVVLKFLEQSDRRLGGRDRKPATDLLPMKLLGSLRVVAIDFPSGRAHQVLSRWIEDHHRLAERIAIPVADTGRGG